MDEEKAPEKTSAYAKRPLRQWIVIYLVIGIVVYGIIYFAYLRKQNLYSSKAYPGQQTGQPTSAAQNTVQNSVYKMTAKDNLGTVMTDLKGMTLYLYAKDTVGVSNCTGQCLVNWPPYVASSQSGDFPANISVVKRDDGTLQYAWKGMPLYYYIKDGDSGDAYGNGIGNAWSVIKQ